MTVSADNDAEINAIFDYQGEYEPEYYGEPVTIENWNAFKDNVDFVESYGYRMANEHYTAELENRIACANNFEELKNELLILIDKKKTFIEFATENCAPDYT